MSSRSCPMQMRCPLYPLFVLQSNLAVWQERYCQSDYKSCARYELASRGVSVPQTLLPNGTLLRKVRSA